VYATSGNGDVACIDANSGRIIWAVNAMEKFGGTYGKWGIAESPLILDIRCFLLPVEKKQPWLHLTK